MVSLLQELSLHKSPHGQSSEARSHCCPVNSVHPNGKLSLPSAPAARKRSTSEDEDPGYVVPTLVNIRSPVERFVSAMDWRHALLCAGMNSTANATRAARRKGVGSVQMKTMCRYDLARCCLKANTPSRRDEARRLALYGWQPSRLAEALLSPNDEAMQHARDTIHRTAHANMGVAEHMGGVRGIDAYLAAGGRM